MVLLVANVVTPLTAPALIFMVLDVSANVPVALPMVVFEVPVVLMLVGPTMAVVLPLLHRATRNGRFDQKRVVTNFGTRHPHRRYLR